MRTCITFNSVFAGYSAANHRRRLLSIKLSVLALLFEALAFSAAADAPFPPAASAWRVRAAKLTHHRFSGNCQSIRSGDPAVLCVLADFDPAVGARHCGHACLLRQTAPRLLRRQHSTVLLFRCSGLVEGPECVGRRVGYQSCLSDSLIDCGPGTSALAAMGCRAFHARSPDSFSRELLGSGLGNRFFMGP